MTLFELSWVALLLACAAYLYELGSRKGGAAALARACLAGAWGLQSVALLFRWRHAGLWSPPWMSTAETLMFGSWALLGAQCVAEFRFRASAAGFFCTALAAASGGIAILKLGSEPLALPVSPVFHHPALWIHLPSGVFAYAFYLLAGFLSCFALIRAGVRSDRFLNILAGLVLLSLAWVNPRSLAVTGALAGFVFYLAGSVLALWLESLDRREGTGRPLTPAAQGKTVKMPLREERLKKALRFEFAVSWLCLAGALPGLELFETPYLSAWLIFLTFGCAAALGLAWRRETVEQNLLELESFDRWSNQAALYAFPALTIHLVSGSVWAYDAWGSYWSWQPQQGWTWIAWLYLALVLHLKHGKVSTAVASCGGMFFVLAAIAAGGKHGFWPVLP